MSVTHRTLAGDWAPCPDQIACELLFHFPDTTPAEMRQVPEVVLWELCEIVDPPVSSSVTNNPEVRQWFDTEGRQHRDYDLPAAVYADGSVIFAQHGRLHRPGDRPAAIYPDGELRWYEAGVLHRERGPAIIKDRLRRFFRDGKPMRPSGRG